MGQGLSIEQAELVRDLGPPLDGTNPPTISDILSADKEGLRIEEIAAPDDAKSGSARRFQVRRVVAGARFCFASPTMPLFREARCSSEDVAQPPRYKLGHPRLFSNMDGSVAVFEAEREGRMEIHARALSEMFDYLGELVRVQQAPEFVPVVQTPEGPSRLLAVSSELGPGPSHTPSIVSVNHGGRQYSVPAGAEGGWSGEVLSIMTELLAQAQSVGDLPFSNRLTIISD